MITVRGLLMVKNNDIIKYTSDVLKEYYSDILNLKLLNNKLEVLKKTKDKIEHDINESNITLTPYLTSVDYSNVKVSTLIGQSTQEKSIDIAYLQLEKQLEDTLADIILTDIEIMDLERKAYQVGYILSTLSEESQKLISLRYKDKYTVLNLALKFNMSPSNMSRTINKVLHGIYSRLHI